MSICNQLPSFTCITSCVRTGKLNVEAAERYGIHGSGRNDIKAGLTVVNKDGETIRPEQAGSEAHLREEHVHTLFCCEAQPTMNSILLTDLCVDQWEDSQCNIKFVKREALLVLKYRRLRHLRAFYSNAK